jgi:hypothetical protein
MKIIATIPYNGDIICPFAFDYIYDYVDLIILVEALETFSGTQKETMFYKKNVHMFPKKEKIRIIEITSFPEMPEGWAPYKGMLDHERPSWFREFYQRDICIAYIQQNFPDEDVVVYVGDADEIPSRDVFTMIRKGEIDTSKPLYLEMKQYIYNFNWKFTYNWSMAFVCNIKALEGISATMTRIHSKVSDNMLKNAGWHCTNFMSVEDISRKLSSFSHQELNVPEINNIESIRESVANGKDLYKKLGSFRGNCTFLQTRLEQVQELPEGWQELHNIVVSTQTC